MDNFVKSIEQFNAQKLKISLEAEYCDKIGRAMCLHLYGELDNDTSRPFEKIVESFFTQDYIPPVLVLECSNLQYVSSTGIGIFVSILMKCNQQDMKLYLSALPSKIYELFSLLGFSNYFTFIDSTSEVIE